MVKYKIGGMIKFLYIFLTTILGLILSFIVHAAIELLYLWWAGAADKEVIWTEIFGKSCALPLWLIYLLPIAGIIFGIWLGFIWWKKIYGD